MLSANSILVVCLLAQLAAGVLISDGQVRLVGGETPYEGTVEIYLRGEWGTICDDRWGIDDAKVVCRMLGHQDVADAWQRAHFGRGTGEIWLDDVECVGNEHSLLGCTTSDIGVHDCTHSEDAGVSCIPGPTTPAVSESIQTTPAGNRTSACGEDPSGSSYRGTVDRAISGRTCQMWTAQEPHEHTRTPSRYPTSGLGAHNYCRNVGGTSFTAWCYTTDPEKRWEYCPVGDFNPECMDSGSADPRECYADPYGTDYRGNRNYTRSGLPCQVWSSQSPHEHTRTPERYPDAGLGDHNLCRNPDQSDMAWCYTTSDETRWEYCDIGYPFQSQCAETTGTEIPTPTDDGLTFNLASGESATISSPNYPQPYDSHTDITWMVSVPEGCGMTLRFDSFSTESNYDKVTISDNPDFSEVADEFSGPQVPPSTEYDFSSVWIRFRSDSSINLDGFEAVISARCPEVTTAASDGLTFNLESGESATISSPNYPQPYDSHTDITWVVSLPEGCGMTLRFDSFSTESNYDKVTISDNPDFSEVADEFSGPQVPPSTEYDFSSVWIRFRSDSSINLDGFEAVISARCPEVTTAASDGLTFNLESGESATISSPNYPQPYDSHTDITWVVSVPEGCGMTLRFDSFSTESNYDKVTISDNPDFSEVADEFSGPQVPPSTEYDFSSVWITFRSDSSINLDGFEAVISARCPEDPRECYVDPSGTDYRGNRNYTRSGLPCQMWTSQSPQEHTRTPENYPDAGLGDHNLCRNPDQSDMAWCYTTSDETRWEYCDIGYPSQSQCAETPSTEMPTTTDSVTTAASDGLTFNLESGESVTISSPNYPLHYDSNTEITWIVSVPEGCGMTLRFDSFSTESTFDKLTIADNPDFSGAAGEFSGALDPTSYDYDFSSAWIKFRSDSSITSDGFQAVISARCQEVTTVAFDGQTFNLESGESVTISSPNYPQPYDSNTDITWMVSVPEGCGMTLDFSSFSTESNFDRLTIADNRDFSGVADEFSGSSVPTSNDYDFSSAWIRFHSDSSITSSGFEAVISARCTDETTVMPTETVETDVTIVMPTASVDSDIMCSRCIEMRSNMPGFSGFSGVGPPCVNFPSRDSVSCPQSGSFGNVTITQLERGCSDEGMPPNVCLTPADLPGVMEGIRGSLEASGLTFQGLEGQLCTCNTGDFCNEGPLGVVATTSAATTVTTEISDGRTFNLESGDSVTIFSPNYPQPYDSSTDITWMVSVPEGCGMTLRLVSFSTERTFDELTIADNPDFSGAAGEFSGTLDPTSYDYDFSSAWIKFRSDSSITSSGFAAVISARCTDETTVMPTETVETIVTIVMPTASVDSDIMCSRCIEMRSNMPGFTGFSGVGPPCVNFPSRDSVSCPQSGSCKFMNITSYLSHPIFGNVTITQLERGCSDEGMPPNICLTTADLPGVMEGIRGSLEASGLTFQGLEGQLCTCNTGDFCNEGPLGVVATTSAATTVTTEISDGRTFNLESGDSVTIFSPNYPQPYDSSTDITWMVSVPEGCGMTLRLVSFSTERTFDELTIADNPDFSGAAGEFSGTLDPTSYDYDFSSAWIRFHSDFSITSDGFEVVISARCTDGNEFPTTTDAGEETPVPEVMPTESIVNTTESGITCSHCREIRPNMPGFPGFSGVGPPCVDFPSPNSVSCPLSGSCKFMNITTSMHHPLFGNVTVTQMEKGCGEEGMPPNMCLTSSDLAGVLDEIRGPLSSLEAIGLTFQEIDGWLCTCDTGDLCNERPLDVAATTPATNTVTGEIEVRNLQAVPLSASSVSVSWEPPVEGANLVTAYAILIWDVATGQLISHSVELPGAHSLLVNNLMADTEYVIDVTPLGREIVSRTASTTVVPPTGSTMGPTTQSSHSQVNLESDGAVAAITSPNFPLDYPDNTNVSWSVTVPSGCQLLVHFVTFDTAFRDWLHIGDGHSYFGPVKPFDFDVNSEHTLIRFVSNDRSTRTGFNITVQADCMQGSTMGPMVQTTKSSHSHVNLESDGAVAVITSPNFPMDYPDNADVSWNVTVPSGCQLHVHFVTFYTGILDWLYIGDDHSYFGPRRPDDIDVNSEHTLIRFVSDDSIARMGFNLTVKADCMQGAATTQKPVVTNTEGAGTTVVPNEEGGSFTLAQGDEMVIASPNFPEAYINLALRTWRFSVDAGCTVEIEFQEFETESNFDTVNIGRGSSAVAQETLSGSRDGEIFHVNDESAWVKFTSDSSVTMGGFKAFVRPVCIP
ncbi:CUB and sushi domain-containing protein 1-like [Diadema setosum]|uniref:CUB and sushi domain-containing protein 1-like n=1 Tax=Diadema setosum TaxID=31175 RepID=UPI003B3A580D